MLLAADVRCYLEPSTVSEGETFSLVLESSKGTAELMQSIEGFPCSGVSQSSTYSSGRGHSFREEYTLTAPKAGKYTIGPLKARLNQRQIELPAMTLNVVKSASLPQDADEVFERSSFAGGRTEFYVGEDIPLTINFYYSPKSNVDLENYPDLNIGKSVFCDFRKKNPRNGKFDVPRSSREIVDQKLYGVINFRTAFRALAPGRLQVSGSIPYYVQVPIKRSRNDYFTRYRQIRRQLAIKMPEIVIKPLPEVPANGYYLNLIGEFSGNTRISEKEVRALEPFSLNIFIAGKGSWETLKAPELVIKSCRVYPGEVSQRNDGVMISYAVIPLKAGRIPLDLKFYYFDPLAGAYRSIDLQSSLNVTPPAESAALPQANNADGANDETVKRSDNSDNEANPRTTLLYCKKSPTNAWRSFYRRNRVALAVLLVMCGILCWAAVEVVRLIKRTRRTGSDDLRRKRAGDIRNELIARLREVPSEELPKLASGEITDFLSDRWKLPAGSTIEDIADKAYDRDLSEVLRECANISYLPEAMLKKALKDAEHTRKTLLKAMKVIALSFLTFLSVNNLQASTVQEPASWDQALKSYDHGDYKSAQRYFEKHAAENPADANVYYNLGCIAEGNDQPDLALYYLECAGLADPLDSAIHENRNVMRRKFFHPELDRADNPLALLKSWRNRLHPDDYLVLAALAVFFFCVIMSMRSALNRAWRWSLGSVIAGMAVLMLICMISLYNGEYRSNRAMIVGGNAELYNFPGSNQGKKADALSAGTFIDVIEERSEYSLVRANGHEGWVENRYVKFLNKQ